jgi:hypothetical protein
MISLLMISLMISLMTSLFGDQPVLPPARTRVTAVTVIKVRGEV